MQDDRDTPLDETPEDALARERDASAVVTADGPVPPAARKLRIATYNIHKGVTSRRNVIHDLRAGLHALEADIVFLQEVQGRNDLHANRFDNWPDVAQHTFLAGDQWAEAAYGRNSVRDDGDHGNALLSRFKLIGHENIDISDHRFESRGLLHSEVEVDGIRVHCVCAHLGLFEQGRVRQADAMVARIRSHVPADAPLIIAGDFNDWRHRLGKGLVERLGVREVFSDTETARAAMKRRATERIGAINAQLPRVIGAPLEAAARSAAKSVSTVVPARRAGRIADPARTFPSAFPLLRLDRMYVRGFAIASAQVLSGPTWRKLSDHAPILAELVFDEAPKTK